MEENSSEEENDVIINEEHMGKIPPTTMEQTKIILNQLQNDVCKIIPSKEIFGTGFFCKINYPDEFNLLPVLITNNHVLDENYLKINKTIKITLNDDKIEKNILIDETRLTYTNPDLDVTIIEIKPEDQIKKFLYVDEDIFNDDYCKKYEKDTPIYILQYPKGIRASHAVGKINKLKKFYIFHSSSTDDGSSGSPILLLSNFKIIGIHKGREKSGNNNIGKFIRFAIEEFNKKFPKSVNDEKSININPIIVTDPIPGINKE